jgi:hypothetical protein
LVFANTKKHQETRTPSTPSEPCCPSNKTVEVSVTQPGINKLRETAGAIAAKERDPKPGKPGRGSSQAASAPPSDGLPPLGCYTIPTFCTAHNLSQAFYYKLKSQGLGPVEMKVGSRRLVSFEAAAEWRREREADEDQQNPAGREAAST